MLIAVWPFVVMLIGILLWAWEPKPKAGTAGMWLFIIGAFWLVYSLAEKSIKIG